MITILIIARGLATVFAGSGIAVSIMVALDRRDLRRRCATRPEEAFQYKIGNSVYRVTPDGVEYQFGVAGPEVLYGPPPADWQEYLEHRPDLLDEEDYWADRDFSGGADGL